MRSMPPIQWPSLGGLSGVDPAEEYSKIEKQVDAILDAASNGVPPEEALDLADWEDQNYSWVIEVAIQRMKENEDVSEDFVYQA